MHAEILIANASKNSIFLSDERAPAATSTGAEGSGSPDCSPSTHANRKRYLKFSDMRMPQSVRNIG